MDACDQELRGRREVVEAWGIWDLHRSEDGSLCRGGLGALGDLALADRHGDQVHAVELAPDIAPGVAHRDLCYPKQEQSEPAELDVGTDAVLASMPNWAQLDGSMLALSARRASVSYRCW